MIVIHHIGSKEGKLYGVGGTLTWFTNTEVHKNPKTGVIENKVSAHYIIPREEYKNSDVIHLVNHADIAYHAGYSQWLVDGKTRKSINNYSIGIELEGDGNFVDYTDFQYETLIELIKDITALHDIPESNIVGHEDVSPGRKVDPGKLFDWKRLRKGLTPSVLFTPNGPYTEVTVTPDEPTPVSSGIIAPPTLDEINVMGGGENSVGKPGNFISTFLKLIQKIFK
jgi:N-acetyl-anhydromuramyl-L-alanine amidase AmpD